MIWGNLERCGIQQLPDFFLCWTLFACAVLDWALCPRREMTQGPDSTFFIRTDDFGNNFGRILSLFHPQKQILCRILSLSGTQKQIVLSYLSFTSTSSLLYPPSILCFFSLLQTNNRCLKSKDLLSGCTIWMDIKYMDLDTPLFLSILSI